jgi:hypothetical protein
MLNQLAQSIGNFSVTRDRGGAFRGWVEVDVVTAAGAFQHNSSGFQFAN